MFPANATQWRVQPVIQPLATSLQNPKDELRQDQAATELLQQATAVPNIQEGSFKVSRIGDRTGLRVMLIQAILPVSLISGRGRFSGAPDRAVCSKCLQMAEVAPTTGLRAAPKALSLYQV